MRKYQSLVFGIAYFACSIRSAMACVNDAGSFNLPKYVVALFVSMVSISVVTFVVWLIQRMFFRNGAFYLAILITTLILTIGLGIFGTFAIPKYEIIFSEFSADLPPETTTLLSLKHFLWLPCIAVIAMWHVLRGSVNRLRYSAAALFSAAILISLVFWALYSPIFSLACVV